MLCCSTIIGGHLPAYIVGGGRPGKVQFPELQKLCYLDLGSGHTAYLCASLIDLLSTYQISLKLEKTCLWMDGH